MRRQCVVAFEPGYEDDRAFLKTFCFCDLGEGAEPRQYRFTPDEFYMNIVLNYDFAYIFDLRFYSRFILSFLVKEGFYQAIFLEDRRRKRYKEYSILRNSRGVIYSITIYMDVIMPNGKTVKNRVILSDSSKKIPIALNKIEESCGYAEHDLISEVMSIRQYLIEFYKLGLRHMTIGADALADFKGYYTSKVFSKIFPELDEEEDSFIRRGYSGGIVYVNKQYTEKVLDEVTVLDVNSMYPDKLRNYLMPYGQPRRFEGKYVEDDDYPLYVVEVSVTGRVKPGKFPFLRAETVGVCVPGERVTEPDDFNTVLTCDELSLLFESYNIDFINYFGGYKFKASCEYFRDFVDFWMGRKMSDTGIRRTIDKLILNNLGGKFGTKPSDKTSIVDTSKEDISYMTVETNTPVKTVYCPVSVFMNSYARCHLVSLMNQCLDRIVYCDTDSIHLIGTEIPDCFQISETELGKFKIEEVAHRAKYLGLKKYIHEIVDEDGVITYEAKVSGLTEEGTKELNMENFNLGYTVTTNMRIEPLDGGARRVETDFVL